ncbi:MAG: hypothetical protein BGO97_11145 [Micrococcales bacterium 70-64]|nr:hypothetical protein [Leifsonia sp.]ODU64531.1 MAG: hypothetical protein ABT06_11150 [Leifsonia sp. SCN 70-46]OJX86223.1 MAG: hypothetical protein BGO97_11145 [Micrococcales bacterium 70-64]
MRRPALAVAMIAIATLSLSACDVLAPTRDTEGRIVKATQMPSTDAWVGDCFTFIDGSQLAWATVVPCDEPHTHVVIGTGTLSEKRKTAFDSLQLAVLSACKDRYELYQAVQGAKFEAEYIVSDKTDHEGVTTTHYSCLVKSS